MPRTPAKFTQADVARALRAIEQTGAAMELVLEPDGRIRIIPRGPLTHQFLRLTRDFKDMGAWCGRIGPFKISGEFSPAPAPRIRPRVLLSGFTLRRL